jgi:DNA replication and repair protein RecF
MWVQSLNLTDIRSYAEVDVELTTGVTTFVGRNGQGKTNLVEAIGYVATLGSHRVSSDTPIVRFGTDIGFIRCLVNTEDREVLVELAITPGRANKARINKSPTPKVRDVLGILRTVLFAPEDLALVKGDPSDRRGFLDDLLVQRSPRLAGTRSDYDRVLKQRNALLKSASIARRRSEEDMLRTLEVWDEQLATIGGALLAARIALLDDLGVYARAQYAMVSGDDGTELSMQYVSSLGAEVALTTDKDMWRQALLDAIALRRKDELDRGITLVGPHRDEVLIRLGPTPAKGYASHGESWSIALAMRLASFDLLRSDGVDPVLILDDVFAELDTSRRERLAEQVQSATQVLITAAVEADVPAGLRGAVYAVGPSGVERR